MANDANKVVYENIVYKKGEGFMSTWKERYLILYIDKRLSYFVVDGLEYKGAILVDNITPSSVKQSNKMNKSDGAKYGWFIQTAARKWEFAVKSPTERQEWITKIRQTIEGNAALTPLNKSLSHDLMPSPMGMYGGNHKKKKTTHNRNTSKSTISGVHHTKHFKQRKQPKTTMDVTTHSLPHNKLKNYRKPDNLQRQSSHNTSIQRLKKKRVKLQRHHSHNEPPPPRPSNGYRTHQQYVPQVRFKPKKRTIRNSVYSNFIVHRYDARSRMSHLFGGYIRGYIECKFPLILQDICQQYASYILIGDLTQFPESVLLRDNELKRAMMNVLCQGMNEYIVNKIELIYRGTRDGMTAKSFHTHCDGHAKTLIVLYSKFGYLFGAYTDVAWSKDGQYHRDDNAFLFVLQKQNWNAPQIFQLKKGEEDHAVLHCKDYGPVFGYGHDLAVLSLTDNGHNTQSCCWSYSFSSVQLIGGWMYCQVTECEVFQIYTN